MAIAEIGSTSATQFNADIQAEPNKKVEASAVVNDLAANGEISQEDADFLTAALTSKPDSNGEVAVEYKGKTLFMGSAFIDKLASFLTDAKKLDGENASSKLELNLKIVEISEDIADNMIAGAAQNFAIVATSSTVASVMVFSGMAKGSGSKSSSGPDGKGDTQTGNTQTGNTQTGNTNSNNNTAVPYGATAPAGNSEADDSGMQLNTTIVGNALIQLGGAAGNFANTFFQAENTELEAMKTYIQAFLSSDLYVESARVYGNY
jgi:hypothetical protein